MHLSSLQAWCPCRAVDRFTVEGIHLMFNWNQKKFWAIDMFSMLISQAHQYSTLIIHQRNGNLVEMNETYIEQLLHCAFYPYLNLGKPTLQKPMSKLAKTDGLLIPVDKKICTSEMDIKDLQYSEPGGTALSS